MILKSKDQCSGCFSCYNICPMECISFKEDKEGFWYPKVDFQKCIQCHKCEEHCPSIKTSTVSGVRKAYAVVNKDDRIRQESSSGGVFYALANYVILHGGVVYGAAFTEDYLVEHIRGQSKEELDRMRGAKYVQSRIGLKYREIKKNLDSGKMVYFSGTPCQVNGLMKFLGKSYENLICQDVICHGVPASKLWKHYLSQFKLEKDAKVFFRNKDQGWEDYNFVIDQNKKYQQRASDNLYMRSFVRDLCLRPSCYKCGSKDENRTSDITLGDFWGIKNISKDMNDQKGTSLVIVNSEKGKKILELINNKIKIQSVELEKAVQYNPSYKISAKCPIERTKFMNEIYSGRFNKIAWKYVKDPFILRVKIFIYRVLNKIIL